MRSALFAILIAICSLLAVVESASAKAACTVFGPTTPLAELERALLKIIDSKELLYVTKLHRTLEIYYDTQKMTLLNEDRFIRFQAREKLGRVKSIAVNQQEKLIQKKSKFIMEAQIEAKDGTVMTAPLRQYQNASSHLGKHPLLGMIERDNQEEAVIFLQENGIAVPQALKAMLHVSSTDIYVGIYGKKDKILRGVINIISYYDTKTGDIVVTRCIFDDSIPLINEIAVELGEQFGGRSGLDSQGRIANEYTILYHQMAQDDPFFDYKIRYPSVFNLGQAGLYFLCGLGVIGLLFGKRFFQDTRFEKGTGI